ncbi:transposase [Candidatus Trichorickettsia mobilis]|uniref:transposase n=1 Tax=Candidatus Trichorickettsia mobilis TaxID=1346319 RepID=UPI0029315EFD|nr:transposase [Candidatus Trichorickettsia mobilis]
MSFKRTKVSREIREQVLHESMQVGCDVELLAKKHKLSPQTICKWQRSYRKQQKVENLEQLRSQFIELPVLPITKPSSLKKVELLFDNYSCCIEGRMNSAQLLKLVQLLEGEPC